MESILYNAEDKQVALILGYSFSNSLSLSYLQEMVDKIRVMFPALKEKADHIKFYEVDRKSRSHRSMWYTIFDYDLSEYDKNEHGALLVSDKFTAYPVRSHKKGVDGWTHEDDSAKDVMNRLIHD